MLAAAHDPRNYTKEHEEARTQILTGTPRHPQAPLSASFPQLKLNPFSNRSPLIEYLHARDDSLSRLWHEALAVNRRPNEAGAAHSGQTVG
jgi:hypothetical protein